jgi:hypothetical protein
MTDGDYVPSSGWQPMATAPRDRTWIIVKLTPGSLNRKRHEHIVRWDDSSSRGVWRSYADSSGLLLRDERCVGWRPLDDAGREFLKQRREREAAYRKRLAKGKTPPRGSSSVE